VDTLRIAYGIDDHHMRHHTDRIIALADVRKIRITVPYVGPKWLRVDAGLLPVACHMDIALFGHRALALTRPKRCCAVGALPPPRSLRALRDHDLLRLSSLCSLTLNTISVEEPPTSC
jgi:hypothetical protein